MPPTTCPLPAPNLAQLHRRQALRLGPRVALRTRRHGLYRDLSWDAYHRQAEALALALIGSGLAPGDRVGLLSENRVEWLIADLGILAAGGVTVPLHAPLTASQVQYQLAHSGCRTLIVSGQAQADKLAGARDRLPDLQQLVSFDPIEPPAGTSSTAWPAVLHAGRGAGAADRAELRRRQAALGPDNLATILYTSGTTGQPKGVMLTHGNFLSNAAASLAAMPVAEDDVHLSWLPYSHVYARLVDHYMMILAGNVLCLAGGIDTLLDDVIAAQPTTMTAVPRFYEKVWQSVETLPEPERAAVLRRKFGPRIRRLSSGGAPLPRPIAAAFWAAGIPLLEGYGLTESSPVITFNRLDACKLGTVGQAIPGVDVRIAPDGEILTRGPHVMRGYWNDPEATARALRDGWLYTGDVGRIDAEGFLTITDRKKDLIVTSGGKNIAPQLIERLLVADECIDQAVVYGDRRSFLSALIVPNLETLARHAAARGVRCASAGELVRHPEVVELVRRRVDAAMEAVSGPERVKKFILLDRPFKIEEGQLTATLKVRRRQVVAAYQDQLDALYVE